MEMISSSLPSSNSLVPIDSQASEMGSDWKCVTLELPQSTDVLDDKSKGCSRLIVFEGDSTWIFHLPANGKVLLGRRGGRDEVQLQVGSQESYSRYLWLQNPALSRNHAALTITNGDVTIVDLCSRNGTQVNLERISNARSLVHGDIVSIPGDSTRFSLAFFRTSLVPDAVTCCDLAQLRYCVEHAIRQRWVTQTPMAILAISMGFVLESHPKTATRLRPYIQPSDVIAVRDSEQILIFRPNLTADEAVELAQSVIAALSPVAHEAKVGIAVWPQDGHDSETLLVGALAAARSATAGKVAFAREAATTLHVGGKKIIIVDPIMMKTYERIERLARSDLSVLITGETGTGKELAASAVHGRSKRQDREFIAFSCAGIPEELAESEFFGHEKGAFSGAIAAKQGLFERADGGTVFLDEVAELTPRIQAKLLRVLQERTIRRVGSTKDRPVDIRIISATNRDLEQGVKSGSFRADLFFRLNSAVIILPPLRARRIELPILARCFLAEACKEMNRPPMRIADSTMEVFAKYTWPGNIRELKNLMDCAAAAISDEVIEVEHLRELSSSLYSSNPRMVDAKQTFRPVNEEICDLLETHLAQMTEVARTAISIAAATAHEGLPGVQKFRSIDDEVRELERRRMLEALRATAGNKTKAAELISMAMTTFKLKLKDYGIAIQEYMPGES